ncbi:MAG TPA: hypothetical protein VGI39_24350 [Polyangiaceae bacterium]|jgi:alpha-tubulin suppressor-like RCC1 family protein
MSLRSRRLKNVHRLTGVALALGGLGVFACSSQSSPASGPERAASSSQALTTSCQALDVAVGKDGDDGLGGTTYAIHTNGQVYGWGANPAKYFPLGSSATSATQPTPAPIGVGSATSLAAGRYGACAIANNWPTAQGNIDGAVVCWGWHQGLNPLTDSMNPGDEKPRAIALDATGLPISGARAIALGDNHGCALMGDTSVSCWGDDYYGELGDQDAIDTQAANDGSRPDSLQTAVRMANMVAVSQIAASGNSTCILRTLPSGAGEVDCLGDNSHGQLGQGSVGSAIEATPMPLVVPAGMSFTSLYGGGDGIFCATGTVSGGAPTTYCWGDNGYAQVRIKDHAVAPSVYDTSNHLQAPQAGISWAEGDRNACDINASGGVSCWGTNTYGQIAGASGVEVDNDTPIPGLANAMKVAIGQSHICALTSGSLSCWGRNKNGEIGNGTAADSATPVSNVYLSTPSMPACGAGNIGDPCGTFTSACGSETCTCTGLNSCNAATQQCADDPNKCAATCGSGTTCANHQCVPYCEAQAPDSLIALTSTSFNLTTPDSYGANACGGYILEVTNSSTYTDEGLIVAPSPYPTASNCNQTRVVLSYYSGNTLLSTTTTNGNMYTNPSTNTSYCTYGNYSNQGVWTQMPSAPDLRIVANAQYTVGTGKGSTGWVNMAIKVLLFNQCQDGVQDGNETGVDCGGHCRVCRHCLGNTHDCGDGKCVTTACP